VLTKLLIGAFSLQILTMIFGSIASAQSPAQQPQGEHKFERGQQEMLSCGQRLNLSRRLFEQDCSASFSDLKQSDSCTDRCNKQEADAKDKCVEICTTCQQVLDSIAHLEQTCGGSRD
jgi:hypothetical protein